MFKNDNITATNGKFTFPDLGDAYKEAIILTFIAVETVSIDYARKKLYPDGKVNKYSLDNLSKEMINVQKEVLDKSAKFVSFFDGSFQFEFSHGEIKRIESKFFKKKIDKYAYAINKMFEHIFALTCKYNVPDETVKRLSDNAKKVHEKMYSHSLEGQIIDVIFKTNVKIDIQSNGINRDGNGTIEGQPYGVVITLYALKELINNVTLDESKPTTLKFNTENHRLFVNADGSKKILNTIIDDTIVQINDTLDDNINNDTYNKELGHILYLILKNSIEKRSKKRGE
jgi:hypothetical protein